MKDEDEEKGFQCPISHKDLSALDAACEIQNNDLLVVRSAVGKHGQ
jgi:hypothetical protein